jgi:hypothetical protein
MAKATPVIIQAMTDAGADRLVFLSSLGVGDSYAQAPPLLKVLYKLFLGPVCLCRQGRRRTVAA